MGSRCIVKIRRKWGEPNILVWVNDEEIGMAMKLEDFIVAVSEEVSKTLGNELAVAVGNPALLLTQNQLRDRLNIAVGGTLLKAIQSASYLVEDTMKEKSATVFEDKPNGDSKGNNNWQDSGNGKGTGGGKSGT